MRTVIDLEMTYVAMAKSIDDLVYMHDIDYIDACLLYCEQNNVEIEFLGELIRNNPYIKAKVQHEAEDLNFLKKTVRLPI